ncbi:hypothetical protein TEA_005956 [Camellia sinensis var. sinensis]|uniref:non-specific serine/threonine protein kinase n=1 Tax=Camellia sinensis var. sinensis TaxID=542762 RepID=A0A4S4ECF3_CAMSN|nr:hypothetical protein TEA_005956 [Camellia sinensis var. sinensis]
MGIKNNPAFMFWILFLFFFSFINHLSHGADTISANQSLSGDQTITSAGGNFKLGFYKPGNSSYYYISMWYTKVSTLTIVWVANRDNPISDKYSSVLKILDGNLVILNESQTLIWSTNQNSTTYNSVVAVLGDDGNLILRDGSNSNQPIWQSFDHPAHAWLPGVKIAYNKLTNTHQRLTSWKNSEDPSTGLYSFSLDANNSRATPTTHLVGKHTSGICFNPKSLNDWNLSDYSGGCVRRTELLCGNITAANQEKDRFWEISTTRLPEFPQSVAVGSAAECESSCLNNCSCTAYAYDSNGCSIWIGELMNLQDGSGNTLYLRLAAFEFPKPKSKKGIIIGVVGSVPAVVLLGLVFVVIWKRQRRLVGTKALDGSLVAFRYKDLQKATKNFSEKIGGGGFGSVFKGTLPDSTVIAVKKLESINQGEKQFRVEVCTLGTIQHVNLVRLRGFCSEGTAKGLVYLHENCKDCIIHCDIKPSNILLDIGFRPKVADFGLAKLLGREFSRVLTTMRGTTGYLAPEWILGVAITTKADVYSYGMMLFELISGRRNTDQSEERIVKFFPISAASVVIKGGDVLSLLDHRLEKHVDVEEVWRICKVACWCIQDDENDRPSMGQVVQILEGILDVEPSPIPRLLKALVAD